MTRPFEASADFGLIVHPDEASSTVGTAWILRRSIKNLVWIRSDGEKLDQDPNFLGLIERAPLLLFPGTTALNLNQASDEQWTALVPRSRRPLFLIVDGSWNQAKMILRKSAKLRALPRVSFDPGRTSEYTFKRQPHPACLSCVEGAHRTLEILAQRGWGELPPLREHDQMIEIFRSMIAYQIEQGKIHQAARLSHQRPD
jgi:DTW domain-containing protein YfiP